MTHHDIFKIITFGTMLAALIAHFFSDSVARFILATALCVCSIWAVVNVIILGVRIKNRENLAEKGFGMAPVFYAIAMALILGFTT